MTVFVTVEYDVQNLVGYFHVEEGPHLGSSKIVSTFQFELGCPDDIDDARYTAIEAGISLARERKCECTLSGLFCKEESEAAVKRPWTEEDYENNRKLAEATAQEKEAQEAASWEAEKPEDE